MEEKDIRSSINEAVNGIQTEKLGEDVRSSIKSAMDLSEEYMTKNLNFIEELNSRMEEYRSSYNEAENTYKDFSNKVESILSLSKDMSSSYTTFKNGPWGEVGNL